jgi:hypothetical protein
MANSARKKPNDEGRPAATIRAFTDSAERIGADNAVLGTIAVLGFTALAVHADTIGVVVFAIVVWVLYIFGKLGNAYLENQKVQTEVGSTRANRGGKILEAHADKQSRLGLPKPKPAPKNERSGGQKP